MPRDGTAHRYQLTKPIKSTTPLDGKTPAQKAILYYLQVRAMEKRKAATRAATQAEIIENTGMAERSVGSAVRALVKSGEIF